MAKHGLSEISQSIYSAEKAPSSDYKVFLSVDWAAQVGTKQKIKSKRSL